MIVPVFQGIGHDQSLIEINITFPVISFHIQLLVEQPAAVFSGVFEPADIIGIQAVFQMPSGGLQTPLAQIFFELFNGLRCYETAAAKVVEFPVAFRRQSSIRTDDKF